MGTDKRGIQPTLRAAIGHPRERIAGRTGLGLPGASRVDGQLLHGLSSSDFASALEQFLGPDADLSPASIIRLKTQC